MRLTLVSLSTVLFALTAFAQSDRGTITGTIVDQAGAVVANAAIEARNVDTGSAFPVASSSTGNYTIAELPAGTYVLNITVQGFKKFVRPGLLVQAAQTIRVDATMEVGNTSESVTVLAEAPLLETESGAISSTISTQTMDTLPLLEIGTNGAGIRNPYNLLALVPGAVFAPPTPGAVGSPDQINGGRGGSETILIDGMDATNALGQGADAQAQPGQDQIQEWTVQASNYSAEFGQAGQAVYNVTMKSGTNVYHGNVFENWQNAYLNAGQPFTNNGNGKLVNPANTQNDYGMTFGGPVWIPKLYNGRNKTFFFFNWEQYIRDQYVLGAATDVPTAAYRQGNFAGAIVAAGNHNIGTDPLGGAIFADEIYDPSSRQTVNGQVVTTQFPNNAIPLTRQDPIALKIQSLLPQPFCVSGPPCNPLGSVNNFQNTEFEHRQSEVPSVKLDQVIGSKDKLSFFWNRTMTYCLTCYGDDGMAQPISDTFGGGIYAKTLRLNYDHTITPTLLLHLGIGYNSDDLGRPLVTPNYNACTNLNLCSQAFTLPSAFPNFTGLVDSAGGMANGAGATAGDIGNTGRTDSIYNQFNSIASLTWVKGNHTFKFGGELRSQGNYSVDHTDLQGSYGFSDAQTAMPYVVTTVGGVSAANIGAYHIGQPYASFLLGDVNTATLDPTSDSRFGKHSLAGYMQDSWKVTRKFTLELGLRYDYSTYFQEQYGRSPNFDATLPNAAAGGQPGATEYQATCNCQLAKNYPWGFGPRMGFAYQFLPKTVFRGGFGIIYAGTGQGGTFGGGIYGTASANNPFGPSGVPGAPIMTLDNIAVNGTPITQSTIKWPNLSSSYYPIGGILPGAGPQSYDPNGGRPPRQYQYSAGIQREIIPNLLLDVSYVGNYVIWWYTAALTNLNYLSNAILSQNGLSLNNPANLATLVAPIGSAAAGVFEDRIPFTGFPLTATVAQSLRPFPQFNSGLNVLSAPLGDISYNALQAQVNKRFSHGLQFSYSFVWQKNMDTLGGTPDIQNRQLAWKLDPTDQPLVSKISWAYTTPKWGSNRFISQVVRDWTLTGFLQYASGTLFTIPTANTVGYPSNLNLATMAGLTFQPNANPQNEVPGQPLFQNNLNCHCFNPNTAIVLNPAAWANPAPGQFGSAANTTHFSTERRPVENMGLGRRFQIKERISMNLRVEFVNIFNRTYLNNPSLTSPQTAPVCVEPNGTNGACSQPGLQTVSGFGTINTTTTLYPPRVGQIIARFSF